MSGLIYIIEFSEPLGTDKHRAQYYMGWTNSRGSLKTRLEAHMTGGGAAITAAAYRRGISMRCIFTITGTRKDERRYKNQKNMLRLLKKWGVK